MAQSVIIADGTAVGQLADPTKVTLTGALTSQAEIERIFSENACILRADDNDDNYSETSVWAEIIYEADAEVFMYLGQKYNRSDLITNYWTRKQASYIGCFILSQRRGNPAQFTEAYERVISLLSRIRDGELGIPDNLGDNLLTLKDDSSPALSNIRVDDRFRLQKQRVQPQTSTGKPSSRQHLAPDILGETFR